LKLRLSKSKSSYLNILLAGEPAKRAAALEGVGVALETVVLDTGQSSSA
jgi:hypothetical protein